MGGRSYAAFLSYSHRDRDWAVWLHRALESYRVPRALVGRDSATGRVPARLTPIFRDRDDLAASPDLGSELIAALEASRFLIVLCSPAAATSRWIDEEVRVFKRLHGSRRILTAIVAGEPFASEIAGREAEECFPPALRHRIGPGATAAERTDPIAADLRPEGDGRRLGRMKLIAGMLGAPLDELVHRDTQQRQRRLVGLAGVSLAGMVVTSGLALTALHAQHEAERQKAQAEGLVEFMLGDLRGKLEPVGRLDVMDSIGQRALAYYATQHVGDLDASSLGRRSRALQLIGEIRVLRGDLDGASRVFQQALDSTQAQLARSPGDGQRIFDHAQSVYWVGYVDWQRGRSDRARSAFQTYQRLAEQLTALDPSNDAWAAEVDYAYSNLGTLDLQQGRIAEAANAFERSRQVAEALARKHPDEVPRQIELAQSYAWLADALERQGRLAESRVRRVAEVAIYQRTLKANARDDVADAEMVVALRALARLARAEGDDRSAHALLRQAVMRSDGLVGNEPDNMQLKGAAAIAHIDRGETLLCLGQPSGARAEVVRATQLIEAALAHDARVALWREYREQTRLLDGALSMRSGKAPEALAKARLTIQNLQGIPPGRGPDNYAIWLINRARLQAGDALAATGDTAGSRDLWTTVSRLAADGANAEPRLTALTARADIRLGRRELAAGIVKQLDARGYHAVAKSAGDACV